MSVVHREISGLFGKISTASSSQARPREEGDVRAIPGGPVCLAIFPVSCVAGPTYHTSFHLAGLGYLAWPVVGL